MAAAPRPKASSNRTSFYAAGVTVAALAAGSWFFWGGSHPQLRDDEQAFSAVDALFTAVTARDETLLANCETRLRGLKDAGRLGGDAAEYLDGVISEARSGEWQAAARRLYKFMGAQRRESEA